MRIAIVTNFSYIDGIGGTELYCLNLSKSLIDLGIDVYWFVPNFNSSATYTEQTDDGVNMVKFATYNSGDESNGPSIISSFLNEMKCRDIKIAHFNEFGGKDGISKELLAETHKAGIKTVVTLHLANYFCHSGRLRFAGYLPCNGRYELRRCSSCFLATEKTSYPKLNLLLAKALFKYFSLPPFFLHSKFKKFLSGIGSKNDFLQHLIDFSDSFVTLSSWFKDVLIVNGFPEEKITHIHQLSPIDSSVIDFSAVEKRKGYVFIGRVHKEKGIELIIRIAKRLSDYDPDIFIDIYGPSYGPYKSENRVIDMPYPGLDNHPNIRYKGFAGPDKILDILPRYKACLLPSIVAEMAPLIIPEANSVHTPVIVSDVPGSVELINQLRCGVVFRYGSEADLFEKIIQIEENRISFDFIGSGVSNCRSVARQYISVYSKN